MYKKHNVIPKCIVCGKFISTDDLVSNKAKVSYYEPSNEFGDERIEFLCAKHNQDNIDV